MLSEAHSDFGRNLSRDSRIAGISVQGGFCGFFCILKGIFKWQTMKKSNCEEQNLQYIHCIIVVQGKRLHCNSTLTPFSGKSYETMRQYVKWASEFGEQQYLSNMSNTDGEPMKDPSKYSNERLDVLRKNKRIRQVDNLWSKSMNNNNF